MIRRHRENDASRILRELVNELDQYQLDATTEAIVKKAHVILETYTGDGNPNKLPNELIATIRREKGSLREIAAKYDLSHEVVRKYRQ